MKRLRRWLFNFAAALSAVLCIALVVLGIRSFRKVASLGIEHGSATCFWVEVERGQLGVWKQRRVEPATQPAPLVIQSGAKLASVRPKNVITSSVLGFGARSVSSAEFDRIVALVARLRQLVDETRKSVNFADEAVRLGNARGEPRNKMLVRQELASVQQDELRRLQRNLDDVAAARLTEWQVTAPVWVFVAMMLILPTVWVIRWRRQRAREMIGMCAVCGYDLRATPERCPECGTAVERNAGKAAT